MQRFLLPLISSFMLLSACQSSTQEHVLAQNFEHPCDFYQAAAHFALNKHVLWGPKDFTHVHDRLISQLASQRDASVDAETSVCGQLQSLYKQANETEQTEKHWYMAQTKTFYQLLDPHSNYLTPAEYDQYEKRSQNQKKSTGIDFFYRHRAVREQSTDFAWTVDSIDPLSRIQGTLLAGDTMVAIHQQPIVGMSFKDIQQLFFQQSDTLKLTTDRGNNVQADFVEAQFSMVQSKVLQDGDDQWLWLRLDHFGQDVGKQALAALKKYTNNVSGYVLDLRGNPGGFLSELQAIANYFMGPGAVYEEVHLRKKKVIKHQLSLPAQTDLPIVVLIDSHTASLAEIFAGELQHRHRALVVGSPSFGKATAQSVYKVSPEFGYGGALKVTEYALTYDQTYTHQYHGIEPDWTWQDPAWNQAIATYKGYLYEKQAPLAIQIDKEALPTQQALVQELSLGTADPSLCSGMQYRDCYHQQIHYVMRAMANYRSNWLP